MSQSTSVLGASGLCFYLVVGLRLKNACPFFMYMGQEKSEVKMIEKCKFCGSKRSFFKNRCLTCNIEKTKEVKDLTKDERKIRRACKYIKLAGVLCLLYGIFQMILYGFYIFGYISNKNIDFSGVILLISCFIVFGVTFLLLGISAMKYKKRTYYAVFIIFPIVLVLQIPLQKMFLSVLSIVVIWCIVNRTSRAILLKRLPLKWRCFKCGLSGIEVDPCPKCGMYKFESNQKGKQCQLSKTFRFLLVGIALVLLGFFLLGMGLSAGFLSKLF
ncbi:MAG: hypothetical protein ABH869_00460 [Candidatus Omnitrophota bacterium]